MELTELSNKELNDLRIDVQVEQERRRTLAHAPAQADDLARRYRNATGDQEGDSWTQPQGAHDAYPEMWTVTHNEKTWVNLIPANVWEPGVSGWREVTDDGAPAEWVQPSGAHDAYQEGERVTFEGTVWESTIDGNVWSPSDHPAGWKKVDEPEVEEPVEEEPIPDPDPETGEPEPEPEEDTGDVAVPDFVQPTGGHDAYNTGDRVTFEGAVYESIIDGNVWSPTDYPAGWTKID